MAYYLVRATAKPERLAELQAELARDAFIELQPFGEEVTRGLKGARVLEDGRAIWEEEDYCIPPLRMERAAVLDRYFDGIEVEPVERGAGWQHIQDLPRLFEFDGAVRT
jgi:hypothetical protein